MMEIVSKAKKLFYDKIEEFGSDPYLLKGHLPLVEKMVRTCLSKHPEADELVCLLGCRLHDVGHYPIPATIDHAVRGEQIVREFLRENGLEQDIIDKVAHCVRAHRCRDVQPESIEAKIVAFSDSASHLIDIMYMSMAKEGMIKEAISKLERDYNDLSLLPEMKQELEPLYHPWKSLLTEYEKVISNKDNK